MYFFGDNSKFVEGYLITGYYFVYKKLKKLIHFCSRACFLFDIALLCGSIEE